MQPNMQQEIIFIIGKNLIQSGVGVFLSLKIPCQGKNAHALKNSRVSINFFICLKEENVMQGGLKTGFQNSNFKC